MEEARSLVNSPCKWPREVHKPNRTGANSMQNHWDHYFPFPFFYCRKELQRCTAWKHLGPDGLIIWRPMVCFTISWLFLHTALVHMLWGQSEALHPELLCSCAQYSIRNTWELSLCNDCQRTAHWKHPLRNCAFSYCCVFSQTLFPWFVQCVQVLNAKQKAAWIISTKSYFVLHKQ